MNEYEELITTLESFGEADVRAKFNQGVWANQREIWVESWLQTKEDERVKENLATAMSLAKEANIVARDANKIAQDNLDTTKSAKNAAWVAAIAAVVALVFAAVTYIQAKP